MTDDQVTRIVDAVTEVGVQLANGDEFITVVGALGDIALALNRIASALEGPWPQALGEAIRGEK